MQNFIQFEPKQYNLEQFSYYNSLDPVIRKIQNEPHSISLQDLNKHENKSVFKTHKMRILQSQNSTLPGSNNKEIPANTNNSTDQAIQHQYKNDNQTLSQVTQHQNFEKPKIVNAELEPHNTHINLLSDDDEYFKATFIYFIICMIIILFFSAGCPKKIQKYLRKKFPDWDCLKDENETTNVPAREEQPNVGPDFGMEANPDQSSANPIINRGIQLDEVSININPPSNNDPFGRRQNFERIVFTNQFDENTRMQILQIVMNHDRTNPPIHMIHRFSQNIELTESQVDQKCNKIIDKETSVVVYSEEVKKQDNMNQESCCICLDNWVYNNQVRQMKNCKHLFHEKCLSSWIKQKINDPYCPMCKNQLIGN